MARYSSNDAFIAAYVQFVDLFVLKKLLYLNLENLRGAIEGLLIFFEGLWG